MAISIDTVYQKVLTLSNKEQRGYITPQEFNLLADKAQKEIVSSYFHNIKTSFFKKKSQNEAADELEIEQEKLSQIRSQFHTTTNVATTTDGRNLIRFSLPGDFYKIATIYLLGNGGTDLSSPTEIIRVDKNDLLNILANPLTKPTVNRPVYVHRDSGFFEIYPMATYTGPVVSQYLGPGNTYIDFNDYDLQTGGGIQGVCGTGIDGDEQVVYDPGASLLIDYWKLPARPRWGYVVVNQKALYNSSDSVNFGLHPMEEEPLVTKILELAGITIEKPQLTKMAMGLDGKTKQEQND